MTEFSHTGDCSIHASGCDICDCGEFHRAMPEIDVVDEESMKLLVAHQCQVRGLTNDYHLACHIKNVYEEYVKILGEEIDGLVGIAHVHGWKSRNVERGNELRAKIEEAKKLIE